MPGRSGSRLALVASTLGLVLKLAVAALVLSTPVLGVWAASSVAAHQGKATWLPFVAGLAAFPGLPLAWDAWSEYRRRKQKDSRARILTFGDRLLLRTFAINFVLIAGLVAARPTLVFTALSTRGDWMLDGRQGAFIERSRSLLFGLSGQLEWLYELAHKNRFEKLVDDDPGITPGPLPTSTATSAPLPTPTPTTTSGGAPTPRPDDPGTKTEPKLSAADWPLATELHPLVRDFPPAEETSFESVARHIKAQEPEPRARIKALHDYVADRIAYDAVALADDTIPAQDARSVFDSRKGVCAGYANLLSAMAKVTGDEVATVVGDARTDVDTIGGGGHAWNAAKIGGKWYLIDATWDSGHVNGRAFTKAYSTNYLLTPPEIFGVDHYPEQDRWQLRARPIDRGEFMRQPMLRARFFMHGLKLNKPDRSQVTVGSSFEIEVDNPRGAFMLARVKPKHAPEADQGERCSVLPGPSIRVTCPFPSDGVYRALLFAGREQYGTYSHVGTFEAVSRR